ncbi:hypothetical protein MMC25_007801 [Agyrium rufum]|nr:hypothetical protein [Agyrium rufum]
MKFTASLVAIVGLTATVSAVAIASPAASYAKNVTVTEYPNGLPKDLLPRSLELEKRDNAGVYLCTDVNYAGYCVHIVAPLYECIPLAGDLNNLVSSLGPDGSAYCLFYE